MATQRLHCKRGQHVWKREAQRGKPPANCNNLNCADDVSTEMVSNEDSGSTVLEGAALADRLMADLAARGQLLSQQTVSDKGSLVYAGPRY